VTPERVEVWQQPGRAWRWRWVGTDGSGEVLELPSNVPFSTLQEAVEAARTAYLGVPVHVPAPLLPHRHSGRRWVLLAVAAVALVLVVRRRRAGGADESPTRRQPMPKRRSTRR